MKRFAVILLILAGLALCTWPLFAADPPQQTILQSLQSIHALAIKEGIELKETKAELDAAQLALQTNEAEAAALKQNEKKAIQQNAELIPQLAEAREEASDYRWKFYKLLAVNVLIASAIIGFFIIKFAAKLGLKSIIP